MFWICKKSVGLPHFTDDEGDAFPIPWIRPWLLTSGVWIFRWLSRLPGPSLTYNMFSLMLHGHPQAWARGGTCPPPSSGNVVKCFCALVVTAKRSVDELFMHYFHNLSSAVVSRERESYRSCLMICFYLFSSRSWYQACWQWTTQSEWQLMRCCSILGPL